MTPLYTLTGNLLAERTIQLPAPWAEGRTHRAAEESFQVGGKGLNVAKMLHRLGVPVTALAFAGGPAGDECRQWLTAHAAYPYRLFSSLSPTRTGLVVRAPERLETTFFTPDRPPDASALAACAEFLDTLPASAGVVLCGSFPGWAEPAAAPLRSALAQHAQRGSLLVDSYGPPLRETVQWPLRLVKINRQEFNGLWPEGRRAESVESLLAEALQRWPVTAWVITDGPRAVAYASPAGIGRCVPPPVTEISATGSGDVLLAGVLATWFCQSGSLAEAVDFALPLAAANAASPGVADFALPSRTGKMQ
jgi:1-phosphofructokinase